MFMKKNKIEIITLQICFKAGSKYQENLFKKIIELTIISILKYFKQSHKNNFIEIKPIPRYDDPRYFNKHKEVFKNNN